MEARVFASAFCKKIKAGRARARERERETTQQWELFYCARAHHGLRHPFGAVNVQLLERVDRDEDRADAGVDLIAGVPHTQAVEQRGLVELGNLHHVGRAVERELLRLQRAGDLFGLERACGGSGPPSGGEGMGLDLCVGAEADRVDDDHRLVAGVVGGHHDGCTDGNLSGLHGFSRWKRS